MGYSFFDMAKDTFKSARRPLSINEVWKLAEELGFSKKVNSSGKTPWMTLSARIYMDIKNNPETDFIQISKRPAEFFIKELYNEYTSTERKEYENPIKDEKNKLNERDLHPLLSTFVYANPHFNCYTKTIYHETSKKARKGYNKWLHPDLVGIYFPFDEFQFNTLKLLETLKENPYKLFSFEMKKELNFNNLREYYFQAVSNSSWAHEGYLVTVDMDNDPILTDEVRRLNNAFGIGLIKLNAINIEQSEVLFPAKIKEILDWYTIDRLTSENNDFKNFIDDLIEDVKLGKVKSKYDKILNPDEYEQYIKEKNIK